MRSSLACFFALLAPALAAVKSPVHARYFEPAADRFVSHTPGATVTVAARGAEYRSGARRFGLRWEGSRAAELEGGAALESYSNYLVGRRENWRLRVPHFGEVRAKGLYPGIDAVYYWSDGKFEFDLVLAPGADAGRAKLSFAGARRVRVKDDGSLSVETGEGRFELKRPVAYQVFDGRRVPVAARFLVSRNQVRMEPGFYDRSRELVIDPVVFASYFGGDRSDSASALAVDPFGGVWVAGTTSSTLDIETAPTIQVSPAGKRDNYLAKFVRTAEGGLRLSYYTYYGGSENDQVTAMTLDANGFVYLTGTTQSNDYPRAGFMLQESPGGDIDAFVTVLKPEDPFGEYVWFSGFYGGAGRDVPTSIAVDGFGAIYVGGYTSSQELPGVSGKLQGANRGGWDAFLIRVQITAPAPLIYATYLGGDGTDSISKILVAPDQTVYLVGYTGSSDFPVTTETEHEKNNIDVFIARIDVGRQGLDALVLGGYVQAGGLDVPAAAALSADGQIWIAGYTTSEDLPIASTAHRSTFAGEVDGFLLRVNPNAPVESWVTYGSYLGGSSTDVPYALALGENGRVAVAGYTFSPDFPHLDSAPATPVRGADAFVTLLDTNVAGPAALVVSRTFGGSLSDAAVGVGFTQEGFLAAAGSTTSFDLPSTDESNKTTALGLDQSFIVTVAPPAR